MIEGLAGQASSRLLSGAISTIGGLNVQIKAPYEKTFLGELNRKTDEK
jgi:hypothetical protein